MKYSPGDVGGPPAGSLRLLPGFQMGERQTDPSGASGHCSLSMVGKRGEMTLVSDCSLFHEPTGPLV